MSPDQTTKLLSELVYGRLLECIDSESLVELEQQIAFALHECGFGMNECVEGALGMIQAALVRFANHPQGWAPPQAPVFDDNCALCEDLETELAPKDRKTRRKAS